MKYPDFTRTYIIILAFGILIIVSWVLEAILFIVGQNIDYFIYSSINFFLSFCVIFLYIQANRYRKVLIKHFYHLFTEEQKQYKKERFVEVSKEFKEIGAN